MRKAYVGEFEELVLLTTAILRGDAYGVSVSKELKQFTGRSASIAAVHISLHRLLDKGLVNVNSHMRGATMCRGGRRKRLFIVTPAGKHILLEIHDTRNLMWNLLPKTSFS
jgi:DNA-binding PadR family transcriptional regulator